MSESHPITEEKTVIFEDFASNFEKIQGSEARLRAAITYMHRTLNNKKPPYFKGFWEARKLCFPLFKEELGGPVRAELWTVYTELTREGRELKNLFDKETTFAVEQIDLAIASLEQQLANPQEGIQALELPEKLKALAHNKAFYCQQQGELNRLNLFASRVNGLRKELTKTEMRVRHKNKFFQRLSKLGDGIFPQRKELIREISEAFEKDVASFVEVHFSEEHFCSEKVKRSIFFFREEIKLLQSCAKLLTINTHAFSTTRESLSACWDRLRGMEKELKKEFAEQKVKSSGGVEQIRALIAAFEVKQDSLTVDTAVKEIETILHSMRQLELTRSDVQLLKNELQKARASVDAQKEQKTLETKAGYAAAEKAKLEKIGNFKAKLGKLQSAELPLLERGLEECRKAFITFSKSERADCEPLMRMLRDTLTEKKEEALLSLSDDARASIDTLEQFLEERHEQKREIKEQLEEYRKVMGGSALDFEKAIEMSELVEQEKERLAKCDHAIDEVEQKIQQLKKS